MAHPLEQKIGQVRRQARRLLVLYALGWTFTARWRWPCCCCGLADYLHSLSGPRHPADVQPGRGAGVRLGRLSLLASPAGAVGWATCRWPSASSGAFRSLTDRLASTLQFLKQPRGRSPGRLGRAAPGRDPRNDLRGRERWISRKSSSAARRGAPWRRPALAGLVAAWHRVAARPRARGSRWRGWLGLRQRRLAEVLQRRSFAKRRRGWPRARRSRSNWSTTHGIACPTKSAFTIATKPARRRRGRSRSRCTCSTASMVARKENVTRPFWYRAEGGDDRRCSGSAWKWSSRRGSNRWS